MESLYILIPVALVLVSVAVGVFVWSVKSGQYDDLDTEARRILFDDDKHRRSRGDALQNERQRDPKSSDNPDHDR